MFQTKVVVTVNILFVMLYRARGNLGSFTLPRFSDDPRVKSPQSPKQGHTQSSDQKPASHLSPFISDLMN